MILCSLLSSSGKYKFRMYDIKLNIYVCIHNVGSPVVFGVFWRRERALRLARRYSIDKRTLLLAILCLSKGKVIRGKTRLAKMVYIVEYKLLERGLIETPPFHYTWYKYGPFNKEVFDEMEKLVKEGLVELGYKTKVIRFMEAPLEVVTETHYRLVGRGLCEKLDIPAELTEVIRETVQSLEDLPLSMIIRKVYREVPLDRRLITLPEDLEKLVKGF